MPDLWVYKNTGNPFNKFFFLIKLFINDVSMEKIIEQQFQLSKYANINISESEFISCLDLDAYYSLLVRDEKNK